MRSTDCTSSSSPVRLSEHSYTSKVSHAPTTSVECLTAMTLHRGGRRQSRRRHCRPEVRMGGQVLAGIHKSKTRVTLSNELFALSLGFRVQGLGLPRFSSRMT